MEFHAIALIAGAVLLICGGAFAITLGVASDRLEKDRHAHAG